jgi:hypothetical protein
MASETGARQHERDAHFMLYKLFDAKQKNDSATDISSYIPR